jgi:nitroreductase
MELYEVMRTTAAVREFTGEPLPDEVLERILDNARFAPSGGNRQGARVIVVRDPQTRVALAELTKPGARRYAAQSRNGETPWNAVAPPGVPQSVIDETPVPDFFILPLTEASVVLVVCVDLGAVAATDQELERVGIVGGASVYPLVWNILLAARNEGYGGNLTTMAIPEEPGLRALLGIPETYAVAAVLPLGKPVRQVSKLTRRPVSDLAVQGRFDGKPFAAGSSGGED